MDEQNERTPEHEPIPPPAKAPDGYYDRRRTGAPRTAEDRAYDRARQQRSRALRRELDEEDQAREADEKAATDPEYRAQQIVQQLFRKIAKQDRRKYGPGQKAPADPPEQIRLRNETFDRDREHCERRNVLISKRTLWCLSHSLPVGWASSEFSEFEFPYDMRLERLNE